MIEAFDEVNTIYEKLHNLKQKVKETEAELDTARSKLPFACGCGMVHTFGECRLIIETRYVGPYGCSDGDYYTYARMCIDCPEELDKTNRLLFESANQTNKARTISPELAFKRYFTGAFLEVLERSENHKDSKPRYFLNTHIDEHQDMYGI